MYISTLTSTLRSSLHSSFQDSGRRGRLRGALQRNHGVAGGGAPATNRTKQQPLCSYKQGFKPNRGGARAKCAFGSYRFKARDFKAGLKSGSNWLS